MEEFHPALPWQGRLRIAPFDKGGFRKRIFIVARKRSLKSFTKKELKVEVGILKRKIQIEWKIYYRHMCMFMAGLKVPKRPPISTNMMLRDIKLLLKMKIMLGKIKVPSDFFTNGKFPSFMSRCPIRTFRSKKSFFANPPKRKEKNYSNSSISDNKNEYASKISGHYESKRGAVIRRAKGSTENANIEIPNTKTQFEIKLENDKKVFVSEKKISLPKLKSWSREDDFVEKLNTRRGWTPRSGRENRRPAKILCEGIFTMPARRRLAPHSPPITKFIL